MTTTLKPEVPNLIRQGDTYAIKLVNKRLIITAKVILKDYGIRNHQLAKEIADEVIDEIYSRKRPFDETRNINGYLYCITKNIIFRNFRQRIPIAENNEPTRLLDILPETDSDISLYELDDVFDQCLKLLHEKDRELMEGLIKDEPAEYFMEKFGYKNMNVFCARKSQVVAKFRDLVSKHGVDI